MLSGVLLCLYTIYNTLFLIITAVCKQNPDFPDALFVCILYPGIIPCRDQTILQGYPILSCMLQITCEGVTPDNKLFCGLTAPYTDRKDQNSELKEAQKAVRSW